MIHKRLGRLIHSLTITKNQKEFLQEKANILFNGLKSISQNHIDYWSSLNSSKNSFKSPLDRFWLGGSLDRGLFIKNRFDICIYFVYKSNNSQLNEQINLTGDFLFELLYSNLKLYQLNHREYMKLLKEPPYGLNIPIRMDHQGISILFDCIPAIELQDGYLIIPHGTGGIKKVNMKSEVKTLSELNKKQKGKIMKLVILLKYWNFNWGKPIKGYLIEYLIDYIFDKIEIQKWNEAVKIFFNRAISILDEERFLPDRVDDHYSVLDEYPSNDLNKFLELFIEANNYAQKGKWKEIFSDL